MKIWLMPVSGSNTKAVRAFKLGHGLAARCALSLYSARLVSMPSGKLALTFSSAREGTGHSFPTRTSTKISSVEFAEHPQVVFSDRKSADIASFNLLFDFVRRPASFRPRLASLPLTKKCFEVLNPMLVSRVG